MENKDKYVLCYGTFITVIMSGIKQKAKRRGVNNGGITEPNCYRDLEKIVNFPQGMKLSESDYGTVFSKFKCCTLDTPEWFLIKNDAYQELLDNQVKMQYVGILQNVIKWSFNYLDLETQSDRICKALLELARCDESVDDNTEIYANKTGRPISFNDLYNAKEIHVQSLILGMWHFITMRDVSNKAGEDTIDKITTQTSEKARRKLATFMGKSNDFKFNTRVLQMDKKPMELKDGKLALKDDEEESDDRETIPGFTDLIEISDNVLALPDDAFKTYLESVYDNFYKLKTLFYRNEPKEFEKMYLCNDVARTWNSYEYVNANNRFSDFNYLDIVDWRNNQLILFGTGGLGKSMMMRHLLLDAIKHYNDYKVVPLFVFLKDFKAKYDSFDDFLYEVFKQYDTEVDRPQFRELLQGGRVFILLDGIDEINSKYRNDFENQIDRFTRRYSRNVVIMSSRPFTNFTEYARFSKLKLLPLEQKQSIDLVKNLVVEKGEESRKLNFIKLLEDGLYESHKPYAENPLLLTIMLRTYIKKLEIPNEMYKFYEKTYETLYDDHDHIKPDYQREFKTKLPMDQFAEYFQEFCFIVYQQEEYDPTPEQCKEYFESMDIVEAKNPSFTWKDFMDDLVDVICLMFMEGQKYHFIHKSILEYFCACYFKELPDDCLEDIGDYFETHKIKNDDKTFDMLYAMKKQSVEERIFIPFLEKLIMSEKRQIKLPSYEQFLKNAYVCIYCDSGEVAASNSNSPASYLYKFIAMKYDFLQDDELYFDDIEEYEEFICGEYVKYDDDYCVYEDPEKGYYDVAHGSNETIVSKGDVPDDYIREFGEPDVCGCNYEIPIENLFTEENEPYYLGLVEQMEKSDFPLRIEFERTKQLLNDLKSNKVTKQESLRDKLKRKKQGLNN